MNSTAYSPYQLNQGFWPFSTCNIKPLELPIHPAFIHTPYPNFPIQCGNAGSASNSIIRNKSDSFTIDAILSRDRVDDVQHSPESKSGQFSPENRQGNKDTSTASRRHARLQENSHPYCSPTDRNVANHSKRQIDGGKVTDYYQSQLLGQFRRHTESIIPHEAGTGRDLLHVYHEKEDTKAVSLKSDWKTGKGKRIRTIFTPDQLERLEAEFEKQQYMVGTERYYLACSLSLSEAQVKVWFQNRRIKWRKMNLEQQQAKLASFDLFRDTDGETDSVISEEEDNRTVR